MTQMRTANTPLLNRGLGRKKPSFTERFHIDGWLMIALLVLTFMGLLVLSSAGSQDEGLMLRQYIRLGVAFGMMFLMGQIKPRYYMLLTPWIYAAGLLMLVAVLLIGDVGKGAQRWLDLKVIRFQPSEFMKLAVPMMAAYYFAERPLPCRLRDAAVCMVIIIVPTLLIAKQPDLGTALLIASSGVFVVFLAGLPWRYIFSFSALAAIAAPVLWFFMHDYQKKRVLTFLNPESDPLGSGYHIIQSKIAIGSGGVAGKGWFEGTQSHLEFLPERSTDFIFAVLAEEMGLIGVFILLLIYLAVIGRSAYISMQAQNTYARLLAGSITFTFGIYIIINIGMVSGLLPVVGLPLPLVSYGGTSVVTLMAGFGILMSIQTHRHLVSD